MSRGIRLGLVSTACLVWWATLPGDAAAEVVARASVASDGSQAAPGPFGTRSGSAAVSGDGRVVAFTSNATNLGGGCTGAMLFPQIYVHDRATGETTCVSRASGGGAQSDAQSTNPALSADGRRVAFQSTAGNLTGDCSGPGNKIYVHDRATGITTCASPGLFVGGENAALSADGRVVAYEHTGPPAPGCSTPFPIRAIYVRELGTGMVTCMLGSTDLGGPSLSGDGRVLAFGSFAGFGGCGTQLHAYVHHLATGVTTCVSRSPAGTPADNSSFGGTLGADGRIMVFGSLATNLLGPGVDTNGREDVFVARVPVGVSWLVTGAGAGGGAHVRGFDPAGGATPLSRIAFGGTFGVQVATGDLDGDGAAEVITGAGPGGGPHVRMFTRTDASAELLPGGAFVYAPAFTGGVYVAAGKVVDTPAAQLVTGPGAGGGPHVRIFDVSAAGITERAGFFAFHPAFGGGVRIATCDVDGDGRAEVVVGAGPGGGSHVRVIGLEAGGFVEKASFFAYEPEFAGGVYVGCGAVDRTGLGSIVTGKGEGGSPHVRVWSVDTAAATVSDAGGFLAFAPGFVGGVRVAVGDVDGSGVGKILAAAGPGGGPHVRAFEPAGTSTLSFFAYNGGFLGGVFVGGYEP